MSGRCGGCGDCCCVVSFVAEEAPSIDGPPRVLAGDAFDVGFVLLAEDAIGRVLAAGRAGVVLIQVVSIGAELAFLGGDADLAVDVDLVAYFALNLVAHFAQVHLVVASGASLS